VAKATEPATKFPAIPATQTKQRNRRTKQNKKVPVGGEAKEGTQHSEVSEPLPVILQAAPPMDDDDDDDDDDEYDNKDDSGLSDEENRKQGQDDDTKPGAVRIAGLNRHEISQQSFSYAPHQGAANEEEEAKEPGDGTSMAPHSVVAEAVDEEKLFHEMLNRHDVVQAENVVSVGDDNEGKIQRSAAIKKRSIVAATVGLAVIVIAAVVIAVVVTRSKKQSSAVPPTPPPSTVRPTAPHQPTAVTVSLLGVFRSILLNYNVSSGQDLSQSGTAQSEALNWLSKSDKFLNASSSAESIIDRYVLALIYYADGGVRWRDPGNFLTSQIICLWNNYVNITGAFCTTLSNVSNGNVIAHVTGKLIDTRTYLTFCPFCF
jgi:hypothetical protein